MNRRGAAGGAPQIETGQRPHPSRIAARMAAPSRLTKLNRKRPAATSQPLTEPAMMPRTK
jgi:hypothetical protein